ncbi:MAG: hypothetical protein AAFY83_06000, partial [Pseudomonadota bacterium]
LQIGLAGEEVFFARPRLGHIHGRIGSLVSNLPIKDDLQKVYVLRRILSPMGTTDAIEFLIDKLKQTKSNEDFFDSMNT